MDRQAEQEIRAAARQLARLSEFERQNLIIRSLTDYAASEGLPDPIIARRS